jgi:nicotinamide-nucleotide amidase
MQEAVFKIHGISELKLKELIEPLALSSAVKISIRAHFPDLALRLTAIPESGESKQFTSLRDQISILLHDFIYAESNVPLEEVVGSLLNEKKLTLALAESCTGGLIAHRITRIAGSSAYFVGGSVSYSNREKIRALGVNQTTLEKFGAVSRETALEMSQGILERTGASIALSVTGIAGPTGGSSEKPVGTVWVSIASATCHDAKLLHLGHLTNREQIIQATSQAALNWLRQSLLEL